VLYACQSTGLLHSLYVFCLLPSLLLLLLLLLLLVFFWYSAVHSRSMTPITWQAAVDDEEQQSRLQDIFEAAVNGNHV